VAGSGRRFKSDPLFLLLARGLGGSNTSTLPSTERSLRVDSDTTSGRVVAAGAGATGGDSSTSLDVVQLGTASKTSNAGMTTKRSILE
jgi:hypothetical protein